MIPNSTSDYEGNSGYNAGVDLLSNGFKIRSATTNFNGSGETHIYAAFAESPFKYATVGASLNAAPFIAWEF